MLALSPEARVAWQAAGAEVNTSYGLPVMSTWLQVKDKKNKAIVIKIVNAWAPTSASTEDEIEEFYEQLSRASHTKDLDTYRRLQCQSWHKATYCTSSRESSERTLVHQLSESTWTSPTVVACGASPV